MKLLSVLIKGFPSSDVALLSLVQALHVIGEANAETRKCKVVKLVFKKMIKD